MPMNSIEELAMEIRKLRERIERLEAALHKNEAELRLLRGRAPAPEAAGQPGGKPGATGQPDGEKPEAAPESAPLGPDRSPRPGRPEGGLYMPAPEAELPGARGPEEPGPAYPKDAASPDSARGRSFPGSARQADTLAAPQPEQTAAAPAPEEDEEAETEGDGDRQVLSVLQLAILNETLHRGEEGRLGNPPSLAMQGKLSELLNRLGIPASMKVHSYLLGCAMMAYENPDILDYAVRDVYPKIGGAFRTTPSRVERAIRKAIELSFVPDNRGLWHDRLRYPPNRKHKPSEKEFIALLAALLKN